MYFKNETNAIQIEQQLAGKAVGGTMLIFNHKSQYSCMVLRLIFLH